VSELQSFISQQTPSGWSIRPFWSLFRRTKQTGFPDEPLLSVYRDFGVIPKSSRDDNFNKESEDLSNYQLVDQGYLVTNKMKAWQGSIAVSRYRGIVSPAYYVYYPQSDECDQFLHYLLRSEPYIALYGRISKGIRVNQWDLEHEALRNIPILLPDLSTQRAIANFLDRETARIDQLIERKKRFVELLDEKKSSVLDWHIFGKGQNVTKYRSNKHERFPQIPMHWGVINLRRACELLRDGTHLPPPRADEGIPLLSVRNIMENKFVNRPDDSLISKADYRELCRSFVVRPGDVLMAIVGATIGKVAIVNEMPPFHIQRSLAAMRPKKNVMLGIYLCHFLRGQFFQSLLWEGTSFSAQPGVYLADLGRFPIALPPIQEQAAISAQLEQALAPIEATQALVLTSVGRLHEFRAALITAAVTGQIDVATWSKRSTTDHRLDDIEAEMAAAPPPEPQQARA
jgi:type I restriction enzyme S subunit